MKIILNILIVVFKMCASEGSVYDWHVRTIERDSDFGDDLKMQAALNNERQQELLQMSGKINNKVYYPYSYYNPFNKNNDGVDVKAKNQNIPKNLDDIKYEEKANVQPIFYQNNNYTQNQGSKKDNNSNYGNNIDYDYNAENAENNYRNDRKERDFLKNFQPDQSHDHSHDVSEDKKNKLKSKCGFSGHIGIDGEHEEFGSGNYEIKDKKNFNKHKNDSNDNANLTTAKNITQEYLDFESFVGTNLFDSTIKKCFSTEDVVLFITRRDFERLIPTDLPQCLLNDHVIALLLNYFSICHQIVIRTTSIRFRHLAQKAFYDTLGGYLNFYMVPVTKYSYYAGEISLNTVQQVLALHQECRKFLNTNGNGWKAPLQNILTEFKSAHIEPLHIPNLSDYTPAESSYCRHLCMKKDDYKPAEGKMLVELPKLEAENARGFLGNIWLPFHRKRTFDLKAESSAYIVVKFYETVTKCYRSENIDQQFYNEQFKAWLLKIINIHLSDDEFYPGLGAVLRIYEYLKRHRAEVIGIESDLRKMETGYLIHQIESMELPNRSITKQNETNEKPIELKATIGNILNGSIRNTIELTNALADEQSNEISARHNNKLEDLFHKFILGNLDLTLPQIAILAISAVAIMLVVITCCCKYFCKKKESEIQVRQIHQVQQVHQPPTKNSSSSSSNLFDSPIRFFHIKKKSTNEPGNKKSKKSVQIEKTPLLDSSASSSPVRNKKSKESTANKGRRRSKDSVKK